MYIRRMTYFLRVAMNTYMCVCVCISMCMYVYVFGCVIVYMYMCVFHFMYIYINIIVAGGGWRKIQRHNRGPVKYNINSNKNCLCYDLAFIKSKKCLQESNPGPLAYYIVVVSLQLTMTAIS